MCEVYKLKRFFKFCVSLVLMLGLMLPAFPLNDALAANEIKIFVNGNQLASDVAPIIENSRTLLPFRACAEALGADVQWIKSENSVIMTKDGTTVKLYIGTDKASINNQQYVLDVKSQLKNNRTLVPLRFVGEALECKVEWISATRSVEITTKQPTEPVEYTNPLTAEEIQWYQSQLLTAVNGVRTAKGIGTLSLSAEYSALAQSHSEDMAAYGYLGSTSSRNGSLADRAAALGLYSPGENVAQLELTKDGSINAAVTAWQKNYLTNAVLLQPTAAYIGIGVAAVMDNPDKVYVTVEIPATAAYFSEKPSSVDENGCITLAGYCLRSSADIKVYKLNGNMTYESCETHSVQIDNGKFSLQLKDLEYGSYLAKISNDSFVFVK